MATAWFFLVDRLFQFTLMLVVGLALFRGGRAERWVAALFVAAWLATGVLQRIGLGGLPLKPIMVVDGLLALGLAWVAARHRAGWVQAVLALQALMITISLAQLASAAFKTLPFVVLKNAIAYVQMLTLAVAVLRRWIGPPARLPPEPAAPAADNNSRS